MKQVARILVTGAGGFIGHHLVNRLKAEGHWVRGVDLKHPDVYKRQGSQYSQRIWDSELRKLLPLRRLAVRKDGTATLTA